jgi:DNA-directed RNA polymerase beta subunit
MNENQIYEDIGKNLTKSLLASKDNLIGNQINSFNWFLKELKENFHDFAIRVENIGTFQIKDIDYKFKTLNDDGDYYHDLYPNEARLRNMTYSVMVYAKVYFIKQQLAISKEKDMKESDSQKETNVNLLLSEIMLFELPIMLGSRICKLHNLPQSLKFQLGECLYDYGGYFIIQGKEKMIMGYETSKKENFEIYKNDQNVYIVKTEIIDIPYFILMRALGVETDKAIIEYTFLNLERYKDYLQELYDSLYSSRNIFTQKDAKLYISRLLPPNETSIDIFFNQNLFPRLKNWNTKAYNLGYCVFSMITKTEKPLFKRIQYCGKDLYELFQKTFSEQLQIWKTVIQHSFKSIDDLSEKVFENNRHISNTFQKYFLDHFQDLDRSNFFSSLHQLMRIQRNTNTHSDYGFYCPLDRNTLTISSFVTTDCNPIQLLPLLENTLNLIKLEDLTTPKLSTETKVIWNNLWIGSVCEPLKEVTKLKMLKRIGILNPFLSCYFDYQLQELILWSDGGRLLRPLFFVEYDDISYKREDYIKESAFLMKENKKDKNNTDKENEKQDLNDSNNFLTLKEQRTFYGDVMMYINETFNQKTSIPLTEITEKQHRKKTNVMDLLFDNSELLWNDLISGFFTKKEFEKCQADYSILQHYETLEFQKFNEMKGIIDYVELFEQWKHMIAKDYETFLSNPKRYNYVEIHPTWCLSLKQCYIPFLNQTSQYSFYQEVSLYHSNFNLRIDNNVQTLEIGHSPLVRTMYEELKPIPYYGVNLRVAVFSNNNIICLNKGSVQRGLFRNCFFECYEFLETDTEIVCDIENSPNILNKRSYIDFQQLDNDGIIKIHSRVCENTALIGRIRKTETNELVEDSVFFKEEYLNCFVDHTTIIRTEKNKRIFKIRIRYDAEIEIGDKLCTRNGIVSTVGEIREEVDMPFNHLGLRPDLIIDPEIFFKFQCTAALKEIYFSEISTFYGCSIISNPFDKFKQLKYLQDFEIHSESLQLFYDGEKGIQIEGDIFQGLLFVTLEKRKRELVEENVKKASLKIDNCTGFLSPLGNTFVAIPEPTLKLFQELQTINVYPRIITEESFLKNSLFTNHLIEDYETVLNNMKSAGFKKSKKIAKASSKRINKKQIALKQIEEEQDTEEDKELNIENIYQPIKEKEHDVQVIGITEALQNDNKINDDALKSKKIIIKNPEEETKETITTDPDKKNILDLEEDKKDIQAEETETSDKKTIVLEK